MRGRQVVTPCSGALCGHGISLVAARVPCIAAHAPMLPVSLEVSSMASGRSLNWRQQQALVSLIRSREPALLTIGPTDTIDGQLHINYETAEALERRELVRVVPHD